MPIQVLSLLWLHCELLSLTFLTTTLLMFFAWTNHPSHGLYPTRNLTFKLPQKLYSHELGQVISVLLPPSPDRDGKFLCPGFSLYKSANTSDSFRRPGSPSRLCHPWLNEAGFPRTWDSPLLGWAKVWPSLKEILRLRADRGLLCYRAKFATSRHFSPIFHALSLCLSFPKHITLKIILKSKWDIK